MHVNWYLRYIPVLVLFSLVLFVYPCFAQNLTISRDQIIDQDLKAAIERAHLEGTEQSQENFKRIQQQTIEEIDDRGGQNEFGKRPGFTKSGGIGTNESQKKAFLNDPSSEQTQEKFQKKQKQIADEIEDLRWRDELGQKSEYFDSKNQTPRSEESTQKSFLKMQEGVDRDIPPVKFADNPLEVNPEPPNPDDIRSRLKKIEFALQAASQEYHTNQNYIGEKFEKDGALYGIYASYTYRRPYRVPVHSWKDLSRAVDGPGQFPTFMRMEGDLTIGQVDYESPWTGKREGFTAWQANIRLLGGYDFLSADSSLIVTPYTGIGYRRFSDQAGGWVNHHINDYVEYENVYNYIYVPIGVEALKHFNQNWDVVLKFEGSVLVGGTVDYNLSDISGLYQGTDADTGDTIYVNHRDSAITLKSGFGLKSSVKLIRQFERYNLFAEPFFELWSLRKSKQNKVKSHATNGLDYESVASPLYEPANYTAQFGLRLGIQL